MHGDGVMSQKNMAWTLTQVREKTDECKRKVIEFSKLVTESTDDEEKEFYISLINSYKEIIKKGEAYIDKQIGKLEILT